MAERIKRESKLQVALRQHKDTISYNSILLLTLYIVTSAYCVCLQSGTMSSLR